MIQPYCPGINCPLKNDCQHFNPIIDVMKDIYMAFTPYNHIRKKCEHHKNGSVIQEIQDLVNKKNESE